MKILIVTQPKETGLTYHRQTVPHRHLQRNYEGYEIDTTFDISEATKEELGQYQIVTFLRLVNEKGKTEELLDKCKDAGCKTVIDIDDYWHLHPSHELHKAYKEYKIPEQTISGLTNCDWVTTTTEHFADKIKQFNENVTVLPNSIDAEEKQFIEQPYYSDRVRLGWIGGVYHSPDIALMASGIKSLWKTDTTKFQLCLGGYNPNHAYNYLEGIFTDFGKFPKDKEYWKYLNECTEKNSHLMEGQPYKRLWGKNVNEYATLYNEIDVALVPLVSNSFNSFKSQIKIIEAGWFKKACIVSNVKPYTFDCTKENSILINPKEDRWGSAMKSLILHPERIKELGEKMHEVVKEKYVMDKVNVVRDQLYKRIAE